MTTKDFVSILQKLGHESSQRAFVYSFHCNRCEYIFCQQFITGMDPEKIYYYNSKANWTYYPDGATCDDFVIRGIIE